MISSTDPGKKTLLIPSHLFPDSKKVAPLALTLLNQHVSWQFPKRVLACEVPATTDDWSTKSSLWPAFFSNYYSKLFWSQQKKLQNHPQKKHTHTHTQHPTPLVNPNTTTEVLSTKPYSIHIISTKKPPGKKRGRHQHQSRRKGHNSSQDWQHRHGHHNTAKLAEFTMVGGMRGGLTPCFWEGKGLAFWKVWTSQKTNG